MKFVYHSIEFTQYGSSNFLAIRGEITNKTPNNYSAVVFRVVIYVRGLAIANMAMIINGFGAGQTKFFERQVEEVDCKMGSQITSYEIYDESAY